MAVSELIKLQNNLESQIGFLELSDRQKTWLKVRFLDQLIELEQVARRSRNRFFGLKTAYQVSSLIVPTLISLNNTEADWQGAFGHLDTLSLLISAVAAIAASIEQLYSPGDIYATTRGTTEKLKRHFYEFAQSVGFYSSYSTTEAAYPAFAAVIEDLLFKNAIATTKSIESDERASVQ